MIEGRVEMGQCISVVIPMYNSASTICRAIESVLVQTSVAFEVIVVDDASTDNSVALVREHYGSKVKLICMESNKGPSTARNAGIGVATGDYVAFLDADDRWHKDKLRLVKEALAEHPEISFLFHKTTLVDVDTLPEAYCAPERVAFSRLLAGNFIHTPCVVAKRTEQLRFDESMRYMEDYDLWLRLASRYGVWFLNNRLTQLYRPVNSAGGISADRWAMRKGEMRAMGHLVKLNPMWAILVPVLWIFSLFKHAAKSMFQ